LTHCSFNHFDNLLVSTLARSIQQFHLSTFQIWISTMAEQYPDDFRVPASDGQIERCNTR